MTHIKTGQKSLDANEGFTKRIYMPVVHIAPMLTHAQYVEVKLAWQEFMGTSEDDLLARNRAFEKYAKLRDINGLAGRNVTLN